MTKKPTPTEDPILLTLALRRRYLIDERRICEAEKMSADLTLGRLPVWHAPLISGLRAAQNETEIEIAAYLVEKTHV